MKNNTIKQIAAFLRGVESILIFAHKNPDGDAIGSAVCSGLLFKSMGKKVDYALQDDTKGYAALFEEGKNLHSVLSDRYDAAFVVDSSTMDYIYQTELLARCAKIVLIDHHQTNEGFGDYAYIDPQAAAAGELIYALVKEFKVPITTEMAHALYVSLSEDTGNFTYSNTTAKTHHIIAELYEVCNDFHVMTNLLKMYDSERLLLMKAVLEHTEFYHGSQMIIAALCIDNGIIDYLHMDINTDGIIDMIRHVRGCKIAVFIKQNRKDEYKISLRSNDALIDVAQISKAHGGGGHKKAAGFDFVGEYDDLIKILLNYADGLWTVS